MTFTEIKLIVELCALIQEITSAEHTGLFGYPLQGTDTTVSERIKRKMDTVNDAMGEYEKELRDKAYEYYNR